MSGDQWVPMTRRLYAKSRAGDKVRTVRELRNGLGTCPAGTVFTITRKRDGLFLDQLEPCPCCGVAFTIGHVPYTDVEVAG